MDEEVAKTIGKLREDYRLLLSLKDHQGFIRLVEFIQEGAASAAIMLANQPVNHDGVLAQEYSKGKINGLFQLTDRLETLTATILQDIRTIESQAPQIEEGKEDVENEHSWDGDDLTLPGGGDGKPAGSP